MTENISRKYNMPSEFEDALKGLEDEIDSFKKEIFEQNQMISSRLFIISDILNELRAEIETIDAALIKE